MNQKVQKESARFYTRFSSVCLYNKKNITRWLRYEFYVLMTKQYLTREMLFFPLEHKIHIFAPWRLTPFGSSTMARNDVIVILTR